MHRVTAADIASRLRRDIEQGVLRKHDRLASERALAAEFGVARNTLREAIMRLEEQGYVEIRASSGTFVTFERIEPSSTAISNATPMELIDARFALEPHICRMCVMHGRQSHFLEMEALCQQMEAARMDPIAFAESDTAFHKLLAKTTGNTLLIWIMNQISSVRLENDWALMRNLTLNSQTIDEYNKQHRQILNAMRTREPERAAQLMKMHLESARLSLTRASDT